MIAITGSAGKTTTKELCAAAFKALGVPVLKTSGNLNNLIGAPMTLLQLEAQHELAVVEIGTNARGEIARLAEITAPDVGVVTEVAAAHTEGLGSIENVALEKTDLLRALGADAIAIWNADNPTLAAAVGGVASRRARFGTSVDADVRLVACEVSATPGQRCEVQVTDAPPLHMELRLLGVGAALDATAVLAVVHALKGAAALAKAAQGMETLSPMPGRMAPTELNEVLYLDDSYNANPVSCERSLATARALAVARGGRAIAVIGDMKELGAESAAHHQELGRVAVDLQVALLVGCGVEMAAACDAAIAEASRNRLPSAMRVMHVEDPLAAVAMVRPQLQPRDVVLVKGSRSMRMERVLTQLMQPGVGA